MWQKSTDAVFLLQFELNSHHLDVFYHKDSKLVTIEIILFKRIK